MLMVKNKEHVVYCVHIKDLGGDFKFNCREAAESCKKDFVEEFGYDPEKVEVSEIRYDDFGNVKS